MSYWITEVEEKWEKYIKFVLPKQRHTKKKKKRAEHMIYRYSTDTYLFIVSKQIP